MTRVVTAAVLPTSFCIPPKHHTGTMQNVGVKSLGGDFEFGDVGLLFPKDGKCESYTSVLPFKLFLECNYFNSLEFLRLRQFIMDLAPNHALLLCKEQNG